MNDQTTTPAGQPPAQHASPMDSAVTSIREFLAFKLGDEEYGVDILRVQEIRSFEPPTRMANTVGHVLGVINLRGVIVPIVDLRVCFKLESVRYDTFTVVIVLNIGRRVVGIVVDGVSDVVTLTAEQLHPAPVFTSSMVGDYVLALGSLDERMLILLDIEKFVASGNMGLTADSNFLNGNNDE